MVETHPPDPAQLDPPQDPPHGPQEDDDAPVTAGESEGDPSPPDWPGADPDPSTGDSPAIGQDPAPIIDGADLGWYRCPECDAKTPATPIADGARQPPCPDCQAKADEVIPGDSDAGV